MHELSLCRSIYTIVRRAVPDRRVVAILLDVGALRQVVAPTLEYCWRIVTEDTALAGSDLRVRTIPGALECRECGARTAIGRQLRLACDACASTRVCVVAGEEFMVRSVDVGD